MNYFFGFETKLAEEIDWFFNANHLFLLLFVAGFIVISYFLFSAKSEKGKKITKLVLAGILFLLEVGRIVYKYLLHISHGGTAQNFGWWWTISFQMCAIMTWTTIITLILSAFLKKENKLFNYLYNILMGCSLIGGALTFCYPDCISGDRPFLHFLNIQTVLVHALLIFVPIYLIKIGDLKVELKNIWRLFVGYVWIGSLSMATSLISGENFAFAKEFDLFDLGLQFPWHLPIVMIILVALSTCIYSIFELIRRRKNKKVSTEIIQQTTHKFGKMLYVTSILTAIVFGLLIVLGVAAIIGKETPTILGVFCLLGIVYTVAWLIFAEKIKKYINEDFDYSHPKKTIVYLVVLLVFNLPVGVVALISYLNNKKKQII